jgi:hypothetical protein
MQKERTPKGTWTSEMYKARIVTTDMDIVTFQKRMNDINSEMNVLKEEKKKLQLWISKKVRYKNLLLQHIFDLIPDIPDSQQEYKFNKGQNDKTNVETEEQ